MFESRHRSKKLERELLERDHQANNPKGKNTELLDGVEKQGLGKGKIPTPKGSQNPRLTFSVAPPSIKNQHRVSSGTIPPANPQRPQSLAATALSTSIRKQIDHSYSKISQQLATVENPQYFILRCSTMASDAMAEYIPEIGRLSKMHDRPRLAFDLLLYLGKHSFVGD
jgi:hypothetical protein